MIAHNAWDVMVLGAGPAGMAAATEAATLGLRVALLDEQARPGGQVYRAGRACPPPQPSPARGEGQAAPSPDQRRGDTLRAALAASSATHLPHRQVWLAERGFTLHAATPSGSERHAAPRLILATGAQERVIPVPGWTAPGVIGLAAATILLKSEGVLPGRRVVVAGLGPLLAAVAVGILKAGGEVAAVVDMSRPADWLRRLPALASRPALLARGAAWLARLATARIPIFTGHAVVALHGDDTLTEVEIAPVDPRHWRPLDAPRRRIAADACALGHGLVPDTSITRLLGAAHVFRPEAGGWIAETDAAGRASLPGLYIAGDGAGIGGAAAAEDRGRIAARAAALDAGLPTTIPPRGRAERFGAAISALMQPRPGPYAAIAPATVVCRCEDITRAEIEAALDAGARDVNQAKNWTRCGMGPCQGRMCGETLAELVALRVGSRQAAGMATARAPLRPVPASLLIGEFDYDDLDLPAPAPS